MVVARIEVKIMKINKKYQNLWGFFVEFTLATLVMVAWLLIFKYSGMNEMNQLLLADESISKFEKLFFSAFPIFISLVLPLMAITMLRKRIMKLGKACWYESDK